MLFQNTAAGIKKCVCIFALLVNSLVASKAQTLQKPDKALIAAIDSILNAQVNGGKIPGAVIQVKMNDAVMYTQAYGYAQLFDDQHAPLKAPEKMSTAHLFDIASLTKVVGTTTAIMLLVDKGLISVDDQVGKYIPAFAKGDKAAITIRNLLTHTAGLYEWYPMYYRAASKQETFRLINELPLAFPVGKQRKYSDLGFTVLGEIVELVSNESLEHFVHDHIFIPLQMHHTSYNPLQNLKGEKYAATSVGNPYEKRMVYDSSLGFQFAEITHTSWNGWRNYTLKGEVNDGNAWYANKGVSGAAGLFSTVTDLQKLVDMLMHKGRIGNQVFISEKTIELFLTKDGFNNGLGWMMDPANSVIKNGPEGSFGHTGFTGTSIAVIPSRGISVILLINRQQTGLLGGKEYYNVGPIRQEIFRRVMLN